MCCCPPASDSQVGDLPGKIGGVEDQQRDSDVLQQQRVLLLHDGVAMWNE